MRQVFAICLLFCIFSQVNAQIPPLINYQGHITSETSLANPLAVTFTVFSEPEAGQPLWTEKHTITHEQGAFAVLLGSQTPFPENLFSGTHRYLELRVDNDTAFRPRQRIVSVAYAFRAGVATNAVGNLTPHSIVLGTTTIDSTGHISASSLQTNNLSIGENGFINSQGPITTSLIQTDSLSVGGIGIIDRQGQWTGPTIPVTTRGMVLDTLIVRNLQNTLSFGSATWLDIDGTTDALTIFINLKETGFLDISFHTAVSATGDIFETRITVAPITPSGDLMTNISNVSRFIPDASADEGILSNQAVVRLEPGLYRVFVQGQIQGIGTLLTGILTVRAFVK